MKNLSIILSLVGGAALGFAAGLLLAPEKGETTRERIKEFLREKGICKSEDKLEALVDEIAGEIGK
jgi:gas vesicle protein